MDESQKIERLQNGGVKSVIVKEQDADFVLVKIIDEEGHGEELKRFIVSKDERPVPTDVEEALWMRYDMGPTWFWSTPRLGEWHGQFAYYTNHKYSDNFCWGAGN